MRSTARVMGGLLLLVIGAACGDDTSGSGGGDASGTAGAGGDASTGATTGSAGGDDATASSSSGEGGSGGEGGGAAGTWEPLITGAWELDTGEEITSATFTVTAERDIFVGAIRPIAPLGTHHTVLALGGLGPDNYIYASGVDTNELVFPEGVGLRIPAGESIMLQLHVFNPTPGALEGTSGIEIVELAEGDVVEEAEIFLPGPVDLDIPALQEHTQTGTCTVTAPQTLFALFPHMHQLGTHFRTTLDVGGEEVVLHDEDYEFEHQPFLAFDPIELDAGDGITTTCTWNNTTNQDVQWGESSNAEMCFSILYRWPIQPDGGFCF